MPFTAAELDYLRTQFLGRLATVDAKGAPQANPVGFSLNDDGTIDIGGRAMGGSRKFANVKANPNVALVVDDLASTNPWVARGVEIRGVGETIVGVEQKSSYMSPEIIRIHPQRILSWGVDPEVEGMSRRAFDDAG